jgi:hypothetical protein
MGEYPLANTTNITSKISNKLMERTRRMNRKWGISNREIPKIKTFMRSQTNFKKEANINISVPAIHKKK